jgi:hypothetical protein
LDAAPGASQAMSLQIEKGIPIPEPRKGGRPKIYNWEDLDVGDSVLVGCYDTAKLGQEWARRHLRRFRYQTQGDGSGWRVWRTA